MVSWRRGQGCGLAPEAQTSPGWWEMVQSLGVHTCEVGVAYRSYGLGVKVQLVLPS